MNKLAFPLTAFLTFLLVGCARPPEKPLAAETTFNGNTGKAIVVYGFGCSLFGYTSCSVEFTRLIDGNFSNEKSNRIVSINSSTNAIGLGTPISEKNISYFSYETEPGDYAFKQYSFHGNGATYNYLLQDKKDKLPYAKIKIEPNKINYLGEFIFLSIPTKDGKKIFRFKNQPKAEEYMKTFPGIRGDFLFQDISIDTPTAPEPIK